MFFNSKLIILWIRHNISDSIFNFKNLGVMIYKAFKHNKLIINTSMVIKSIKNKDKICINKLTDRLKKKMKSIDR